jgi:thiol-disulfide isomerase/thioredoxin
MSFKKLTIALSILLLLGGCDSKNETQKQSLEQNSTTKATNTLNKKSQITFTIETIDGKVLHIKDMPNGLRFKELQGKAILLIFFGYRCPPCLREIPRLNSLISKHNNDLEIVALEVQGLEADELKSFVKEHNIKYKVVEGLKYMEFITYIQHRAEWQGAIPFLIALNKSGEVQFAQVGGLFEKELEYIYKEITKDKE